MCAEIAYEGKMFASGVNVNCWYQSTKNGSFILFPFPRLPPFARKASYQHKLQTTIFNLSLSIWISCYNTLNGDQISSPHSATLTTKCPNLQSKFYHSFKHTLCQILHNSPSSVPSFANTCLYVHFANNFFQIILLLLIYLLPTITKSDSKQESHDAKETQVHDA